SLASRKSSRNPVLHQVYECGFLSPSLAFPHPPSPRYNFHVAARELSLLPRTTIRAAVRRHILYQCLVPTTNRKSSSITTSSVLFTAVFGANIFITATGFVATNP